MIDLKYLVQMQPIFEQEKVFFKIYIAKIELVRNILADFDSGKRKESTGCSQISRIFGHQQPCRY